MNTWALWKEGNLWSSFHPHHHHIQSWSPSSSLNSRYHYTRNSFFCLNYGNSSSFVSLFHSSPPSPAICFLHGRQSDILKNTNLNVWLHWLKASHCSSKHSILWSGPCLPTQPHLAPSSLFLPCSHINKFFSSMKVLGYSLCLNATPTAYLLLVNNFWLSNLNLNVILLEELFLALQTRLEIPLINSHRTWHISFKIPF